MGRKILLLFTVLVCSIVASAQDQTSNFKVEDGDIIWQKVFETECTFDEVVDIAKVKGVFDDIETSDNRILGKTRPIEADYKGAGYREMSAPIFISRNFFDCFSLIEIREGRYRVTLRNITLTQKYNDGLSKEGEKSTLESYAVNRSGEIKKSFLKSPSEILDYTFTNIFTFSPLNVDDDW